MKPLATNDIPTTNDQTPETGMTRRLGELRAALRRRSVTAIARCSGAQLADGTLQLALWDRPIAITLPDFVAYDRENGAPLDPLQQALLAYYCHTADGAPISGEWIAFSQLPDGHFYAQAFQGYTGQVIARAWGDDLQCFRLAARGLGGQPVTLGQAAFSFKVLPRILLAAVCWLGDEDFPTSYRILFDSQVSHYLPTDGCAILGSRLTQRLLRTTAAKDSL